MILYLQSNYRKDYYSISVLNNNKNDFNNYDFIELEKVDNKMTFNELYSYLLKKYNCKKLVLDF